MLLIVSVVSEDFLDNVRQMRVGNYEFVQLDVFTRMPLTGNPLAIFTDARGLSDNEM